MKNTVVIVARILMLFSTLLAHPVYAGEITPEEAIRRAYEFDYYKNRLPEFVKLETVALLHRLKANFVGIGLEFEVRKPVSMFVEVSDKPVGVILRVLQYGPAEKSGVKSGEYILAVNNVIVTTAENLANEIRGDGTIGREVILRLQRDGKEVDVRIKTAQFGLSTKLKSEAENLEHAIDAIGSWFLNQITKSAHAVALKIENGESIGDKELVEVKAGLSVYQLWRMDRLEEIDWLIAPR